MKLKNTKKLIMETFFKALEEFDIGKVDGYILENKCDISVNDVQVLKLQDHLVYQHIYTLSNKLNHSQVFLLDNLCQSLQFAVSLDLGEF